MADRDQLGERYVKPRWSFSSSSTTILVRALPCKKQGFDQVLITDI